MTNTTASDSHHWIEEEGEVLPFCSFCGEYRGEKREPKPCPGPVQLDSRMPEYSEPAVPLHAIRGKSDQNKDAFVRLAEHLAKMKLDRYSVISSALVVSRRRDRIENGINAANAFFDSIDEHMDLVYLAIAPGVTAAKFQGEVDYSPRRVVLLASASIRLLNTINQVKDTLLKGLAHKSSQAEREAANLALHKLATAHHALYSAVEGSKKISLVGSKEQTPSSERALSINKYQRAAIIAYEAGEYSFLLDCKTDYEFLDAVSELNDKIFQWIMVELSDHEGCETREDAINRMENISNIFDSIAVALTGLDENE